MTKSQSPSLWSGQLVHFLGLTILLGLTWFIWVTIGRPFSVLFWTTISIPILHQLFVWLSWRIELNAQGVTKSIGYKVYLAIFFLLLIGRPLSLCYLAWVDQETLGLDMVPRLLLSSICLSFGVYAMYSVKRYFGLERAAGADHFNEKYRKMPLVKKGIFQYSKNSMYVFGFLVFLGIAFAFDSKAGLLASAFAHAYIWVHYFATEKPDMDYLYGNQQ